MNITKWWRTRRCRRHGHEWHDEPLLRRHCHRVRCRRCQQWIERHAYTQWDEVRGEGCPHYGGIAGGSLAGATTWVVGP
jgi:hypothetical protein